MQKKGLIAHSFSAKGNRATFMGSNFAKTDLPQFGKGETTLKAKILLPRDLL